MSRRIQFGGFVFYEVEFLAEQGIRTIILRVTRFTYKHHNCYGPATSKWRITRQDKFIDPSTGVDLLKSYSLDYLLL
jgi:hypothetical protein